MVPSLASSPKFSLLPRHTHSLSLFLSGWGQYSYCFFIIIIIIMQGDIVRVQGDEFWHMTKVLRLSTNDRYSYSLSLSFSHHLTNLDTTMINKLFTKFNKHITNQSIFTKTENTRVYVMSFFFCLFFVLVVWKLINAGCLFYILTLILIHVILLLFRPHKTYLFSLSISLNLVFSILFFYFD